MYSLFLLALLVLQTFWFLFLLCFKSLYSFLLTMSTSTKQMDPARKYATADAKKLGCWICNFCGKTMNGGVLRVKHHLVGGFSTVTLCPKVTDHVREEIKAFLLNKANAKAALQMQQPAFDYDEEVEEPRPSQPNLKKLGEVFRSDAFSVEASLNFPSPQGLKRFFKPRYLAKNIPLM
ncbi:hypothetical protein HID58_034300, partial [Brassica napus]